MVQGFTFDERLDVRYLDSVYDGNLVYACQLFEVYLETREQDLIKLEEFFLAESWVNAYFHIHKVEPGFLLVGLSEISQMMATLFPICRDLETNAQVEEYEKKKTTCIHTYTTIKTAFDNTFPIVQKEYQRMTEYLAQYPTLTSR